MPSAEAKPGPNLAAAAAVPLLKIPESELAEPSDITSDGRPAGRQVITASFPVPA